MIAVWVSRLAIMGVALTAATHAPGPKSLVERGGGATPACISCHGLKLEGNKTLAAPGLAGLPAATIIARLGHYASPEGHNAAMKAVAISLSSAERVALAKYISMLPPNMGSLAK